MPRSQWCYRPKPTAPPVSPLPADTYGAITFGSFNNPSKLNRFTLGLWARVLAAVPDSRLKVVSITDVGTRERIAGTLKAEGIVPDRLQILSALPDAEFWRVRGEVDIVLDATPYNGTTTTCEALWAGLPVVTLAGSMGAARSSASLLTAIGLPELIAEEESAFVGIARDWASPTRRDRLRALRGELRERMLRHGLCDGPGFVAALEAHYRSAWMVWCGTGISANST